MQAPMLDRRTVLPATAVATAISALAPPAAEAQTNAGDRDPDARVAATEQRMTDDERFGTILSLMGAVPSIGLARDRRIPEGAGKSEPEGAT